MTQPTSTPIRITLINETSRRVTASLEPLGYFQDLDVDGQWEAVYSPGAEQPHLEIYVTDDGVAVWQGSGDGYGLEPADAPSNSSD
ncbi:hypothetical protein DSM112329_02895 [Paraconexibacter sp. AEG42_29]|uniref:Uncharacterized protein n=1 Tax=Paraconexibacter sp. AEG42_29 TaxID=2997339 RepID=A0AAU7AWF6_9ACTN